LVGSPALRMTTFIGFHRAAKAVGTYATGLASDSSPTVFTFPATPMIVNGLLSILSSPTALSMGSSFGQNLRAISSLMMVTCDPVPSCHQTHVLEAGYSWSENIPGSRCANPRKACFHPAEALVLQSALHLPCYHRPMARRS